jgi:hypothetical protein
MENTTHDTGPTNDIPTVGDFIEIPAWEVEGCIINIRAAMFGSDAAIEVLLQTYPDQPAAKCRWYRLEPSEYRVL